MKKLVTLLLVLTIGATMVACSSKENGDVNTNVDTYTNEESEFEPEQTTTTDPNKFKDDIEWGGPLVAENDVLRITLDYCGDSLFSYKYEYFGDKYGVTFSTNGVYVNGLGANDFLCGSNSLKPESSYVKGTESLPVGWLESKDITELHTLKITYIAIEEGENGKFRVCAPIVLEYENPNAKVKEHEFYTEGDVLYEQGGIKIVFQNIQRKTSDGTLCARVYVENNSGNSILFGLYDTTHALSLYNIDPFVCELIASGTKDYLPIIEFDINEGDEITNVSFGVYDEQDCYVEYKLEKTLTWKDFE